jgi:hypothetical protein
MAFESRRNPIFNPNEAVHKLDPHRLRERILAIWKKGDLVTKGEQAELKKLVDELMETIPNNEPDSAEQARRDHSNYHGQENAKVFREQQQKEWGTRAETPNDTDADRQARSDALLVAKPSHTLNMQERYMLEDVIFRASLPWTKKSEE